MKKIFLIMLIACSAIATLNAQTARSRQQANRPVNVITQLNFIISTYGQKSGQSYSVKKNPNTGILESSEQIVKFRFKKSDTNHQLDITGNAFIKDEPICYQLKHITPGNKDRFQIKVISDSGQKSNNITIRESTAQEMWLMCTKNTSNPQLRDAYAVVWEEAGDMIEGTVFIISSLRPDLFEKKMDVSSSSFRLDGRVGNDIKDSLYVFYMADTYEKLNELVMMTDSYAELKEYMKTHNDVLLMPVTRNHFGVIVDIDKPMGGRIRTIMPDGSLCKLWTNIDMVPGETYRITTHNGYYDEDIDYEMRFGHYTDKGMFKGRQNDDIELTGGYNNESNVNSDKDAEKHYSQVTTDNGQNTPDHHHNADFRDKLTKEHSIEIATKASAIQQRVGLVENIYQSIGKQLQIDNATSISAESDKWTATDSFFKEIYKNNKQIDEQFEDILKTIEKYDIPTDDIIKNGILEYLAKQTQGLNMCYQKFGSLSKEATKCQKQANKLTEKYLKRLSKTTKSPK